MFVCRSFGKVDSIYNDVSVIILRKTPLCASCMVSLAHWHSPQVDSLTIHQIFSNQTGQNKYTWLTYLTWLDCQIEKRNTETWDHYSKLKLMKSAFKIALPAKIGTGNVVESANNAIFKIWWIINTVSSTITICTIHRCWLFTEHFIHFLGKVWALVSG